MIFCVEDDRGIRELVVYTLQTAGYEAVGISDGEELFRRLQTETPELILLDIMLPGEDGITLLKRLRSEAGTGEIPVIMATAKGTEYDKVIGLDLGADDYIVKPFGMMEMVSRVKAVLRRSVKESNELIRAGEICMDLGSREVSVCGDPARLTLKEFDLLRLLLENQGRVYSRQQMLDLVWGTGFVGESRTVDVHIGTLRTKLGPCGEYIETVRGVGYRLRSGQ
ncbi:MAG: response regulator transcription factor [Clostridia bacterium]|nr:response regulator transcription factor [Clostridia bacterium]